MSGDQRDLEVLAVFAHGALAGLHFLAAVFNWRRSGRPLDTDALVHTAVGTYDVLAARKHAKRLRKISHESSHEERPEACSGLCKLSFSTNHA